MDIKRPDLFEDMSKDPIIIGLLKDRDVATLFYGALCNIDWIKNKDIPDDEKLIEIIKTGIAYYTWSCSWRTAGGYIADIRNSNHGYAEDYMNFYCSGNEGTIAKIVRQEFGRLGWKPAPYNDDANEE